MLYNKYVCPNPVTITTDGDEVTFSLVDTRPTSPATKRAILHKAACDYVAQNNLSNQVALNCYGFLPLTFLGGMNSASLLIPGLGGSTVLTLGGEPLTLDSEPLTLG